MEEFEALRSAIRIELNIVAVSGWIQIACKAISEQVGRFIPLYRGCFAHIRRYGSGAYNSIEYIEGSNAWPVELFGATGSQYTDDHQKQESVSA
jgi:hypothetical protein